jgi:hypothetical protein
MEGNHEKPVRIRSALVEIQTKPSSKSKSEVLPLAHMLLQLCVASIILVSNFNKLNKMKGISDYGDQRIVPDAFATQVCTSNR